MLGIKAIAVSVDGALNTQILLYLTQVLHSETFSFL